MPKTRTQNLLTEGSILSRIPWKRDSQTQPWRHLIFPKAPQIPVEFPHVKEPRKTQDSPGPAQRAMAQPRPPLIASSTKAQREKLILCDASENEGPGEVSQAPRYAPWGGGGFFLLRLLWANGGGVVLSPLLGPSRTLWAHHPPAKYKGCLLFVEKLKSPRPPRVTKEKAWAVHD